MRKSLAVASGLVAFASARAGAEPVPIAPPPVAELARTRAIDLRIPHDPALSATQPLVRGMLVSREVAPNATLGLGLANLYGHKKGDSRISGGPRRGRKPAVTFQLRF